MELYPTVTENAVCWPGMMESGYQNYWRVEKQLNWPQLPHLGLTDVLFMKNIMSIPGERQPWGICQPGAAGLRYDRPF